FLQPEIMFSQKGGRYMVGGSGGTVNSREVDIKFSNIDFPLLVGVRLGGIFRINAGPVISFRTSDNGNLGDTFDQYTSDRDYFRKGLIGYQAGIGLDLGKLVFDVRYEGNVRDAIRIDFVNPSNQGQFLSKSNLWQATIGFKFL
ncbi:MAG: outer membrane beta-barrel protein, partial [Sphingobacteriaceae bacterium]|nr:outer membrane beta-barrel protein [Cytophagaceae bacterium]